MGTADYVFLFESNVDGGGDGKVHVFKRLAADTTWSVQDDGNAPFLDGSPYLPGTGNVQFCCWGDSGAATIFILVLRQSGLDPSVTLNGWDVFTFSTSTDTWGGSSTTYANGVGGCTLGYISGNGTIASPTSATAFLTMVTRGVGDYLFFYSGANESISAQNYGRLYYSTYDGITFGASVLLPDQAGKAEPFLGIGGAHDTTNGDDHFFYIQAVSHQNLLHVGLHAGVFGTTQIVNSSNPDDLYWKSNGILCREGVCPPVVYRNASSVERIAIAGEFFHEPFDFSHQDLFVFTANVALNPTWTSNVVTTGEDNTSVDAPSESSTNLFPVVQEITGYPQQNLALAADASSHTLGLFWVLTDPSTFLGHVFGANSSDDGATWAVLGENLIDSLDLTTNDNSMVEVYAWPQAGGGIGVIASQLAVFDFTEATQYASQTFTPPPTPPTCSLSGSPTGIVPGASSTLTWTTTNTPTTAGIDNGVGNVNPNGGSIVVSPTVTTTYILTVTNADGSSTCQVTISVGTLGPSCGGAPSGRVGVAYSATFTSTGGTAPYTFAIGSGSLPFGLTLASDGTVSGVPTQAGVFFFTISVTDANGVTGSVACNIPIAC